MHTRDNWLWAVLLLICLAAIVLGGMTARASPIGGSQVITLEAGPDGLWLSQAWVVEWTPSPAVALTVIYDTWRHSDGAGDWALAYRQWDISATYEVAKPRWLPWSATAGVRWRTGITEHSYGSTGPWEYVMISVGWPR